MGFDFVGWPTRGKDRGRGRENGRDSGSWDTEANGMDASQPCLGRACSELVTASWWWFRQLVQQSMPIVFDSKCVQVKVFSVL